jgi:hypothetical protein
MPKIQDAFKTIKVALPSYEGSEVELKTNLSVSDLIESEKIENSFEKSVYLISQAIVGWNFQDEEEKEVPVSIDTIKQLPAADLGFLFKELTPFLEQKPSEKTE